MLLLSPVKVDPIVNVNLLWPHSLTISISSPQAGPSHNRARSAESVLWEVVGRLYHPREWYRGFGSMLEAWPLFRGVATGSSTLVVE
jgi:hypothetical protein